MFDYLFWMQEWLSWFSWIEVMLKWVIFYFAFFWIALIIWAARDAINRSNNVFFHVFSILLNIFLPVFWLMIYLLVRPPRTLLDKYYEDLEIQALSQWSEQWDTCHKCLSSVEKDYKYCWECWTVLIQKCEACKKDFPIKFKICPYCWKEKEKAKKEKSDK